VNKLFIGGINLGIQPRGGKEYKNQLLIKKIENSIFADTYRWSKNPIIWIKLIFNLFFKRWDNIFLSTISWCNY
jgi:hypothetical protein